jgi:ComF family protein
MSNFRPHFLNICINNIQRLLPQSCVLCATRCGHMLLCAACTEQLPRLPAARCTVCAVPVAGTVCGVCLAHPPHYDEVTAAFCYEHPLDALVQAFKYGGNLALATLLGDALGQTAATLPAPRPDLLIPMPLTPRRLRERGFNQALELARRVSAATGIPVAANMCRKVAETRPQAALPWRERAKNVRGAYVCDADLQGRKVAVIDDVMTTGATLNELAKNLKHAGAAHVSGWIVARAPRKSVI